MSINNKFNFKPTDELFKIRYLNFIVGSSADDFIHVVDLDYFIDNVSPLLGAFLDLVKQSPFDSIPIELNVNLINIGGRYQFYTILQHQYPIRPGSLNRINAYRGSWSTLKYKAREIGRNHLIPETSVMVCANKSLFDIGDGG